MVEAYVAPLIITCIWAFIGIICPFFARGPNKGWVLYFVWFQISLLTYCIPITSLTAPTIQLRSKLQYNSMLPDVDRSHLLAFVSIARIFLSFIDFVIDQGSYVVIAYLIYF